MSERPAHLCRCAIHGGIITACICDTSAPTPAPEETP